MTQIISKLSILTLIIFLFTQCEKESNKNQIILTNNSSIELKNKAISIQRSKLNLVSEEILYPILTSSKGDTIPTQLDDLDGDNSWDELFFVVDLSGNEESKYNLKWVKEQPEFPVKTSVRFGKRLSKDTPVQPSLSEILKAKDLPKSIGFQRYQTDGPSWENDKVAFRHYLDGRNAKDLFGKKTSRISPENVGINEKGEVEDNYHKMENWGRDILSVGNSLGIGGFGLLSGDKLQRLGVTVNDSVNNVETTHFKIKTEGPVRSILNYQYKNWNTENTIYNVEENTTIWPEMYGFENSVKFLGLQEDDNLVVGLVNINTEKPLTEIYHNEKYVILYTHDMQTYKREWWLGLALIVPKDSYIGFLEAPKTGQISSTFLAKMKIENNKLLKYYAIACWELGNKNFTDEKYFLKYIKNLTDELSVNVKININ